MASKREIVEDLQRIVDAGRENELQGEGRELLDAAIKDGLIRPRQGIMGAVQEAISPRFQEDFPEVEPALRMPTDPREAQAYIDQLSSGPLSSSGEGLFGKYVGAQVSEDRYGRPIVQTRTGEQRYLNRGGLSAGDIGRAGREVMGFVEETVPYLAGGGTTGFVRGAMQQGAIGLASEAENVASRAIRGEDLETSRLATTPLIAMAGDLFGRGLFSTVGKIYSRFTGRQAGANVIDETTGTIKPEAIREMRQNASSADIDAAAFNELMDMAESGSLGVAASQEQMDAFSKMMDDFLTSGKATPAMATRYNLFKRMGIEPTRAQITRTSDDFTVQQDLAKETGPVTTALEQQQIQLGKAFETVEARTGGTVSSELAPIQTAVIAKATKLDNEIGKLYKEADEVLEGSAGVDISGFLEKLYTFKPLNRRSVGTYEALRGQVKQDLGIDIPKGQAAPDGPVMVTPQQAEIVRQYANQLFDGANSTARVIIRDVKEALDDDVTRALGRDAYKRGRDAYNEFKRGLDPDQLSKFSKNEKSLIRDLLEQKIAPENVFNRVVASKGYTASDLRVLKNYIVGRDKFISPQGAQAWADLRAETINYIKNEIFRGPLGEQGGQKMTRAGLESVLKRIGMDKLKVIFNKEELSFIKDVMNLSKIIEPIGGRALGSGPSGQAIKQLENTVRGLGGRLSQGLVDLAGSVIKSTKQAGQERMVLSGAAPIMGDVVERATAIRPEIPSAGGALGAGTAAATTEEMR
jgi:hypothetical protein